MNSKHIIMLIPIFFIGLISCNPDTAPKALSYEDTLNHIKNNFKEYKAPKEGWVSYTCDDPSNIFVKNQLNYLGANDPLSTKGKNKIDDSKITDYITETKTDISDEKVLMYLNKDIFTNYVEYCNVNTLNFKLMNTKELVITHKVDGGTFISYYNSSIHLTRLEIESTSTNYVYTSIQTFIYNI